MGKDRSGGDSPKNVCVGGYIVVLTNLCGRISVCKLDEKPDIYFICGGPPELRNLDACACQVSATTHESM